MRIHLLITSALLLSSAAKCEASPDHAPPPARSFCPVPALAAPPATQSAKVFDGIDAALKAVPAGVLPAAAENWTVAKRDVANSSFDQNVKGHPLKLRIKVAAVSKDGDDYIVSAEQVQTPVYTTAVDVRFNKGSALDVARLTVGDDIVVAGQVNLMLFGDQSPVPELALVLQDSGIVSGQTGR